MNVDDLVGAATLAESLSTFRHKKVRLLLTPRGVSVEGKLIRPDGVVILEDEAEVGWEEIAGGSGAIERLIRKVDRALVHEWTHMEPEDDH